jgi:secreted trypsin-like serine protease
MMTSAIAQPGYSGQAGGNAEFNDLAVVTFSGGLSAGYEPAHFLAKADALNALSKNAVVTLAGYGITSAPVATPNPSNPDQGSGTLRQVSVNFQSLSSQQIDIYVAGTRGHDACSGDSGGPAMIQLSGETYVVGVASRSDCRSTSIYTLVDRENVAGAAAKMTMAEF